MVAYSTFQCGKLCQECYLQNPSFFVSFLLGVVAEVIRAIIGCFWRFDHDPC